MLEPAYVSTVDSGNLAGHLIALRQACLGAGRRAGRGRRGSGARSTPRSRWRTSGCRRLPELSRGTEYLPLGPSRAGAGRASRSPRPRSRAVARAARERGAALGGRRLAPEVRRRRRSGSPGAGASRTAIASWLGGLRRRRLADPARARAPLAPAAASCVARLEALADARRTLRHGDGLPLPVRRASGSCSPSATSRHPLARRLVLRPARLRGAAGELRRGRQERRAGGALVPARPHADLRRRRDRRWCRGAAACSST